MPISTKTDAVLSEHMREKHRASKHADSHHSTLDKSVNDIEDEPKLNCSKSQFKTQIVLLLNEYMKEKHRIFDCNICNFTRTSVAGLKILKTKARNLYKYGYCDSYLTSEDNRKNHFMHVFQFHGLSRNKRKCYELK